MIHLLLLPLLGCSGLSTNDKDDDEESDSDTDADSDSDTDADTDADTDTDPPDLSTYEGFVAQHAQAYCGSLETCTYLDDQGYESRVACVNAITTFYDRACDAYQQEVAELCIRGDLRMETTCEESRNGEEPLPCRDVCTPPA